MFSAPHYPPRYVRERQIQNVDVAVWTSIELLSCVQEADMSIPTCSVAGEAIVFTVSGQNFVASTV